MFENGTFVYDVRERSFLETQFKSEVLNVFFSAVLTTLLSYQLSAICYNIFLGLKPKGRATASDFHKLILSEASSPLAILAAVIRNDRVDRFRFKRDIPRNVRIARRETSVSKTVITSLLFLLLVAPLFNIISIFIVLQGDEELTFVEAKFPGIALGVKEGYFDLRSAGVFCDNLGFRLEGAPAALISQFTVCYEFEMRPLANVSGDIIRLSVESTSQGLLKLSVRTLPNDVAVSASITLDVAANNQLYRTELMVDSDNAPLFIYDGQRRLAEYCGSVSEKASPLEKDTLNITVMNGMFKVSKDFECNVPEQESHVDVFLEMWRSVGIVEDVPFRAVKVADLDPEATSAPTYGDANSLPFLVRPARIASVTLLSIALAISVVIRMITSLTFNNDVDEGIEAVVRYRLGTEPHESLLHSSRTVRYNTKRQDGATAHYGLQRSQLPEVDSFGDGIEIGLEENTWIARTRRGW